MYLSDIKLQDKTVDIYENKVQGETGKVKKLATGFPKLKILPILPK